MTSDFAAASSLHEPSPKAKKEVTEQCTPGHPSSFSGVSVRFISTGYSLQEPVQHFILNPSHSVGAKLYPLGELAGRFQPCNMLWRVKNKLLQLPFR